MMCAERKKTRSGSRHQAGIRTILLLAVMLVLCMPFAGKTARVWGQSRADIINKRIRLLQDDIQKTLDEIEESKEKLAEKEERKEDLIVELQKSEREIELLNRNLNSIRNEERRLTAEIRAANERLERSRQSLEARSGEYAVRLRSMYKRQRVSPVEMVFATGSVSSMLRGFKMLTELARADVAVLEDIRERKRVIENEMETIRAALDAQVSLEKIKSSEMRTRRTRNEEREELLDRIEQDVELERQLILERQREFEQAQAEIERLRNEAARSVQNLRISEELKQYDFAGRKGRLPWPVAGRVASNFGPVTDPETRTTTTNRGIEIVTEHGKPVTTVGSGVVVNWKFIRGYGNFVMIYHPPHYYTVYAHLSDILVNKDMEVREGDVIGLAGSTGLMDDSEARLLLEIINGKNPENPLSWLIPGGQQASR